MKAPNHLQTAAAEDAAAANRLRSQLRVLAVATRAFVAAACAAVVDRSQPDVIPEYLRTLKELDEVLRLADRQ